MILAGNGSDDILTIATRTFVPPGGTLAFPDPTYSLYPVLARARGSEGRRTCRGRRTGRCRSTRWWRRRRDAIYLANPNAPTRHVRLADEDRGAGASSSTALVLIDEAYVDFADDNCLPLRAGARRTSSSRAR